LFVIAGIVVISYGFKVLFFFSNNFFLAIRVCFLFLE
jgi:hypothetical protein